MDIKEIKQELEGLLKSTENQIEGISKEQYNSDYKRGLIEGALIPLECLKRDLLTIISKIEQSTPKYLLCTRSYNGCFIEGKKYEIKGMTSKGDYIIKDEYFEAEFTVKLNGYLWTFELVTEYESKRPKLLCTYSFSSHSEFERGKEYEIVEKIDDNRFLVIGGRGTESLVSLDGGLWKFKLI